MPSCNYFWGLKVGAILWWHASTSQSNWKWYTLEILQMVAISKFSYITNNFYYNSLIIYRLLTAILWSNQTVAFECFCYIRSLKDAHILFIIKDKMVAFWIWLTMALTFLHVIHGERWICMLNIITFDGNVIFKTAICNIWKMNNVIRVAYREG